MDVHRAQSAMPFRVLSRSQSRDHLRSSSCSTSQSLDDFVRPPAPIGIPGRCVEDPPPALPPPTNLDNLDHKLAWEMANKDHNGKSKLAPIKPTPSLNGGNRYSRPEIARRATNDDYLEDLAPFPPQQNHYHQQQQQHHHHPPPLHHRQPSSTATIRSLSRAEINTIGYAPSLARRPSQPPPNSPRLHGEKPLAQENFERSSQAYDQRVLSKIGKPNLSPGHIRHGSTDSLVSQKLSLHTKDAKPQRLSAGDPLSASIVTSPSVISPVSMPVWRDSYPDYRSPSGDNATTSLALDPELFLQPWATSRMQATGPVSATDDKSSLSTRSDRESDDPSMCSKRESSIPQEDDSSMRHLNLTELGPRVERRVSRQGLKRRALAPLSDDEREEKAVTLSSESSQKAHAAFPSRSPVPRFHPKHGSVSSTSSSIRQSSSYASSVVAPSAAGTSMTSIGSFERQSPPDSSRPTHYSALPSHVSSPVASTLPSRSLSKPPTAGSGLLPSEMSSQSAVNVPQGPVPGRVAKLFICDCCPKKPKKFDTEDELRTHQMEKQYTCQYCHNRFKNKNEAERHQNSLHLRRHSWSCAAIVTYDLAFHPSTSAHSQSPVGPVNDACGYCGMEFPNLPQPDWQSRVDHLTNIHKFGECNQTKKFFRADHFRQHLKHSHSGQSGKWTNILENVCLREEMPADTSGLSPASSSDQVSQGRGSSVLPGPNDTTIGGATITESTEES